MASQNAIAGTAYLRVDGVQRQLQGSWKIQPNTIKRTGKTGQSGPLGFTQEFVLPYFKGDLSDSGGLSVQQLQNITNSTITLELVNGKNYALASAFWGDDAEINTETGAISASFYGTTCQEITAS